MFLDLRNIKSVVDFVDEQLGKSTIEWLKKQELEGCYSDDLSWLPDSFNFTRFTEQLITKTTGVKVFHACRPESVNNYYQQGFISCKSILLRKKYELIFSDVEESIRNEIFDSVYSYRADENEKTYFQCDTERMLNGGSGHYLIYGSELLLCAARALQEELNVPFVERLKTIGIPTIFELNLPYNSIPAHQIKSLASTLLETWGKWHLFPEEIRTIEFVIITRGKVDPNCIVTHYHPNKILDRTKFPLTFYYVNEQNSDVLR
ncbi:hypothetical protein [Vibrio fluvialis]|uniref:hypothetical protein n=1 Tax=Vibrio fluvialis TaxID=676 RepID=UPI0028DE5CDE|nr:hypothetical protein [Vibrio fluvialis]MDT8868275.1 hypothetical protein [Vibrio fluvialis]MDT8875722.1 hypothetical protein [Vibrio fluvialis]